MDDGYDVKNPVTTSPYSCKENDPLTSNLDGIVNLRDRQAQQCRQQQRGGVTQPRGQNGHLQPAELEPLACQACSTPTSTLSAWCSVDISSTVLDGSGSAVSADNELQQREVRAHALTSINEDWQDEVTLPASQEVTSHAIDIDSEECSCAPSDLADDEAVAACSPFLIIQQTPIGKGTFGTVYKARLATDPSQRYPLAIKQMACTSAKTHKIVKHESDLMHGMHKAGLGCIPQPYDLHWLRDQGKAFLVMERLHGSTLDEVIDSVYSKSARSSPEALTTLRHALLQPCAIALIQAVHEMHRAGFCHADLKNSNAMVTHSEGSVTVRLIDMACSQQQRPGQRRVRGGGTLHHMAPELVGNYISKTAGQPISNFDGFACDVWALGVMLIQLLTGKLPFWPTDGFNYHSMQALLNKWEDQSRSQSWNPVLQKVHQYSPSAADLIRHMLTTDVHTRMTATQAMQHQFCQAK